MNTGNQTILRPSKTADVAAAARAYHRLQSSQPVFDDPLAIDFCGGFWRTIIRSKVLTRIVIETWLRPLLPVAIITIARARFGEDHLEAEVAKGLKQYVIVGAGHDTLALRRPELLKDLKVYEVDQPATQAVKKERIRKAGLAAPEGLVFVAADLGQVDLFDALVEAGYNMAERALFSWFGVTYYLSRETVHGMLNRIASAAAPGSAVMFDYQTDPSWTPEEHKAMHEGSKKFVARRGEPWVSSFNPDNLEEFVKECGYSAVEHLLPPEIRQLYFGENPEQVFPGFLALCRADN